MFGCFVNCGINLGDLSLCSIPLSFSLLPKDLQMSTSMSFIGLTGLDLTPRFVHSAHHHHKLTILRVFARFHLSDALCFSLQEVETFFSEGLTKWRDLNLTEHFSVYTNSMSFLSSHSHLMPEKDIYITMMNAIPLFHSCIFKRSIQQVPVLQHAGFPPEGHCRESETAPVCERQPCLPTAVGVSFLLAEEEAKPPNNFQVAAVWVDTRAESLALSLFFPPPSLVVQLARDLQTDFYPHFPDFFTLITSLLDTKDTELLEWAFTSLSYLYKYLWRLMVKDMSSIYKSVLRSCAEQQCSPHWLIFFFFWASDVNTILSAPFTVYTAHCWNIRRSTFASLLQKASLFWCGRWVFCIKVARQKNLVSPLFVSEGNGLCLTGSGRQLPAKPHLRRSAWAPEQSRGGWSAAVWNVQRSSKHVSLLCWQSEFFDCNHVRINGILWNIMFMSIRMINGEVFPTVNSVIIV